MPRGLSSTGDNSHIGTDTDVITFNVMRDTPVITLTPTHALLYGERVDDAGKLYQEIRDWLAYAMDTTNREELVQDIPTSNFDYRVRPSDWRLQTGEELAMDSTNYIRAGRPSRAIPRPVTMSLSDMAIDFSTPAQMGDIDEVTF